MNSKSPDQEIAKSFDRLLNIIKKLRDPVSGCPWDLKQNFNSLRTYMLEEAYEASAALASGEGEHICDELGDVLLQVVLNTQIASEKGLFNIQDVINNLSEKMVRRHPHVFSNTVVSSAEEVVNNWSEIKSKENKSNDLKIEVKFPAMMESFEIGAMSQTASFDWENPNQVLTKVKEEVAELEIEMNSINKGAQYDEMGDLMFSVTQLARHLKINPELCLQDANLKFLKRFKKLKEYCKKNNFDLQKMNLQEKEQAWQEIKS